MEIREYRSTPGQFRDFTATVMWQDMKAELQRWLDDIHIAMEDEDLEDRVYRQLQGSAKSIRNMMQMPLQIIHNLEADAEREAWEREMNRKGEDYEREESE